MQLRKDLIEEELHSKGTEDCTFRPLKPSNRFIDRLFRHYYTIEFSEHYYDSEPDYDKEEFKMYMDWLYLHEQIDPSGTSMFYACLNLKEIQEKKEKFRFSEEPHTLEELEAAYKSILRQGEEYAEERLRFNNWVDPYAVGIWGMNQKQVDRIARAAMESVKKAPFSYNGRLFIAEKDDHLYIYYFGRDYKMLDYWWVMGKKSAPAV